MATWKSYHLGCVGVTSLSETDRGYGKASRDPFDSPDSGRLVDVRPPVVLKRLVLGVIWTHRCHRISIGHSPTDCGHLNLTMKYFLSPRRRSLSFVAALVAVLSISWLPSSAFAQEWTRFRGPNGTGISQSKGIPTKITEADVNWKIELPGVGHSSPVLWGDKLFLTTTGDKTGGLSLLCLNSKTGAILWHHDFDLTPFPRHEYNSYASSTPTVDSERVYVVWNEPEHYKLAALDHTGKLIWDRDFGPYVSQHGCGTSPIVYDGKVILGNEQDDMKFVKGSTKSGQSSILAVDARTGSDLWQTPRRSAVVTYSTPCLYTPKNGPTALVFTSQANGIYGLSPDSGKVLWEFPAAFDKRSVSSPLIAGDIVMGTCGVGGGGNMLTAVRIGDSGAAGGVIKLAYQIKKSSSYVPTGIVMGELAWIWSDGGILTCIHAPTGEIRFSERVGGDFFGSPIWVDGRLFAVSVTGELVVVEAGEKFNVLHRFPLKELCRTTPAVAGDRLYIRTEKHLWSFGGQGTNAK
jgi:outer membrane protein assembly factor BamB